MIWFGHSNHLISVRVWKKDHVLALITCLVCHKELEIIQRSLFSLESVLCAVKLLVYLTLYWGYNTAEDDIFEMSSHVHTINNK